MSRTNISEYIFTGKFIIKEAINGRNSGEEQIKVIKYGKSSALSFIPNRKEE